MIDINEIEEVNVDNYLKKYVGLTSEEVFIMSKNVKFKIISHLMNIIHVAHAHGHSPFPIKGKGL